MRAPVPLIVEPTENANVVPESAGTFDMEKVLGICASLKLLR